MKYEISNLRLLELSFIMQFDACIMWTNLPIGFFELSNLRLLECYVAFKGQAFFIVSATCVVCQAIPAIFIVIYVCNLAVVVSQCKSLLH